MEKQPYKPGTNYDMVKRAEKTDDLLLRSLRGLRYIESLPYTKIMLVSHGSVGRALRHHIIEDEPFNYPVSFANAQIVEWKLTKFPKHELRL